MSAAPFEHPDLAPLGSSMRAEWRADQEAALADAARPWRHGRSLVDWLVERMHAGDEVTLAIGAQRFVGEVVEVGPDLASLAGGFGRVDVNLDTAAPFQLQLTGHPRAGGTRATRRRMFRDALLAIEDERVTLATTRHDDGLAGRLAVGQDFVSIAGDECETVVPLAHVAWVVSSR